MGYFCTPCLVYVQLGVSCCVFATDCLEGGYLCCFIGICGGRVESFFSVIYVDDFFFFSFATFCSLYG